jgi:hypothetical protein
MRTSIWAALVFGIVLASPAKAAPARLSEISCAPTTIGGYRERVANLQDLIFLAQRQQKKYLSPAFFKHSASDSQRAVSALRQAYSTVEAFRKAPAGRHAPSSDEIIAHDIYAAIDAFTEAALSDAGTPGYIVVDPAGRWVTPLRFARFSNYDRALWLWRQWNDGLSYQVACTEPIAGKPKSDDQFWGRVHLAGQRDNLSLSTFGLSDPLTANPSYSIAPGKSDISFTAQGALGYTPYLNECDYPSDRRCDLLAITVFVDAFYGQDKNAPTSASDDVKTINRLGLGIDVASLFDASTSLGQQEGTWTAVFQAVPEAFTDASFESKAAYFEFRMDAARIPGIWCLGKSPWQVIDLALEIDCSAAAIADVGHTFRSGLQSHLYNDFGRLGGEIGLKANPAVDLCRQFYCTVLDHLYAAVAYKVLEDISGRSVSVQNLGAQAGIYLTGESKGPTLGVSYTNGREDITLFKLPTWSIKLTGTL